MCDSGSRQSSAQLWTLLLLTSSEQSSCIHVSPICLLTIDTTVPQQPCLYAYICSQHTQNIAKYFKIQSIYLKDVFCMLINCSLSLVSASGVNF